MEHYSDQQWWLDLNILPENGVSTVPMNEYPLEKSLSEHIDGVTECMKRFARETEDLKVCQDTQAKKLSALDSQMEKVINHMTGMQVAFNAMRNTLKEIISMVDPGWKVATPQTSGVEETSGPFEMNSLV